MGVLFMPTSCSEWTRPRGFVPNDFLKIVLLVLVWESETEAPLVAVKFAVYRH